MDPSVFDLNNYSWSYLKTDLILFLSCENIMSCYVSVESNGQLKVFHPTERKHGEPCRYKGRNWGVFPRFPAALCGEGPTEAMIRESLGMELAISRKWKNIIGVKGKAKLGEASRPMFSPSAVRSRLHGSRKLNRGIEALEGKKSTPFFENEPLDMISGNSALAFLLPCRMRSVT
jgi:hypothetical protein